MARKTTGGVIDLTLTRPCPTGETEKNTVYILVPVLEHLLQSPENS